MKDVFKGKPTVKFVGLKSKMNCILFDDGKEFSTAKRVNIATEFNEYKDISIVNEAIRTNSFF